MSSLFISDLHARPDIPLRENALKLFLKQKAVSAKNLYLLGDIFEFGFVFRGRILPQYYPLLSSLLELGKKGVRIYFLGGNHDIWITAYLRKAGINIIKDGTLHKLGDKKVQFFHGIRTQPDPLSRFAEKIMLNPSAVWAYSRLAPKIGFPLALKAASFSRKRHKAFPNKILSTQLKVISQDADIVITGHHHDIFHFTYNEVEFYSCGNFFKDFTYLELSDKGLEFKSFAVDSLLGSKSES